LTEDTGLKKALLIAYNFPPLNNGGVQRSLKFVKFLPQHGVNVVVLTHSYSKTSIENHDGVIRVPDTCRHSEDARIHLPCRAVRKLSRLLGIYFSSYNMWRNKASRLADDILTRVRPDLIIATFPPAAALEIGISFSKRAGLPLIADFRDGLLFEPAGPSRVRRHVRAYYKKLENEVVNNSGAITTVSEPISHYFRERYNLKNVFAIGNGFDPDDFDNLPETTGIDRSKFNIVYTGRLSLSDAGCDASSFFDALHELISKDDNTRRKVRLHMIGRFTRREIARMKRLITGDVLVIRDIVEKDKALACQKAADLLLLVTSINRRSVITGKLFEYLCAGKPVLALTHNSACGRIIEETGAGWVVPPHDKPAISQTLHKIITDADFHRSVSGDAGKIEKYSSSSQIEKLAGVINHLAGKTVV
jgi:glycosyltransferase involved in cell wall biosynthesis